jgi:uncharacterized RDD family membrane protein YckC
MIDWVVLFLLFAFPQAILSVVLNDRPITYGSGQLVGWAWVLLTVSLPSWIYFTLCDSSSRGATVGKRLMKLGVRGVAGSQLSRSQVLTRTAVKLLPWEVTHIMVFFPEPFSEELTTAKIVLLVIVNALLLIWLAAPFLDRPKHRALHDLVARSRVVSDVNEASTTPWNSQRSTAG